ncbi:MAG TPA: spherulation-specific family 4 protein [Candidatus Saccharimonadales bacterium]|nr:spherulation-specific family 4 protein [Candidatus Saccharimonadales bacterium]
MSGIHKNNKILSGLVAALVAAVFAGSQATVSAAATTSSIMVPMYEYPTLGTFWDDITGAGSGAVPFVIVNPATGPGVAADSTYTAELAENKADGIRSIGYVNASYQSRDYNLAFADIDKWYQIYPDISGIFIDLIQDTNANDLCYVAGLYNHVKNTHPDDLFVINPGTHISQRFEPYSDIFMNAENTLAVYQSDWHIQYPGWEDNPAYSNRFWHSIHTTGPSGYATAVNLARDNNAGWVYITDDVMPNPYAVTPSYWSTEIADVNSLPDTPIPNRGKTTLPTGCQDLTVSAANTTQTEARQTKTTSAITVANADTTYNTEPTTQIAFALPAGVTLSAAGTGWTCTGTTCSYGSTINASQSASVLSADFTASCDYSSGNVQGTLTNFAGNTDTFSVTPTRPTGCPANTLANAGLPAGRMGITAGVVAIAGVATYLTRTRVHYVHERFRRSR